MEFIDRRQAKEVADWIVKHPKEANAYFDEHRELARLFIDKKISYAEFHKHSDEIKAKYKFLE